MSSLDRESAAAGRTRPATAAWVPVTVVPDARLNGHAVAAAQVRRMLTGYLAAPGYAEMFTEAGFGRAVEQARAGTHPRALLAEVPDSLVECVSAIGDARTVDASLDRFAEPVNEVVALVCSTDVDPVGRHTLRVLAGRDDQHNPRHVR